jgi:hypothetical protein
MKKIIASLGSVASLSLVLGGCSGGTVHLTPPTKTTAVTYTQIERLSRPAIKEVFEPFQDHQKSNAAEPYLDPTIKADIMATEDALRPPNKTLGSDYGAALASVLYPDEYSVNLAGAAPSGNDPFYFLSNEVEGAFGGRAPNDDVIYLELSILFGPTLGALGLQPEDNEEDTCLGSQNIGGVGAAGAGKEASAKKTTTTFPYLPAAS